MWATSAIFQNLPKVNNRPLGENSLNLVTQYICRHVRTSVQRSAWLLKIVLFKIFFITLWSLKMDCSVH
jgi:hypothetical protein